MTRVLKFPGRGAIMASPYVLSRSHRKGRDYVQYPVGAHLSRDGFRLCDGNTVALPDRIDRIIAILGGKTHAQVKNKSFASR
jgi:hypothetical protein